MAEVVTTKGTTPLTQSQLMIWTGQRLQGDSPLYNMALLFRIHGELDVARFQRAFMTLYRRDDSLKTVIVEENGLFGQSILPNSEFNLPFVDFRDDPDPADAATGWMQSRKSKAFHINEPLFDSALLAISDSEFWWYFNQHHVITDAWSMSVMFQATAALYQADGEPDDIEPLGRFGDYVGYQIGLRDKPSTQKAQTYWRDKISAQQTTLDFYRRTPTDRSTKANRYRLKLSERVLASLEATVQQPGYRSLSAEMTHMQLYFSLLAVLLNRITLAESITIGSPAHNRSKPKFKRTMGLFIEVFPVTVSIAPDDTFATVYQSVAAEVKQFLLNAVPGTSGFEQNRDFNVVLNYITAGFGDFAGLATDTEWLHAEHCDRNHLLRLQVYDFNASGKQELYFDLNEDTFTAAEAEQLLAEFQLIAEKCLSEPNTAIKSFSLLTAEKADTVIRDADNIDGVLKFGAKSLVEKFTQSAQKWSADPACEDPNLALSYPELDKRSNQLARVLIKHGVRSGSVVAIIMSRSVDAVVTILAILKAGAAYLPLNSEDPQSRLHHCIEDAQATLVIKDDELRLNGISTDIETRSYTALRAEAGSVSDSTLSTPIDGQDLAYVIFTSGSTGKPKGVAVTHANALSYLCWAAKQYVGDERLSFPLFSSLAFDLTVTSLFLPLITGGKLIIYPDSEDHNDILIRRVVNDNRVDVIKLTPAHLSLLQSMDLTQSRIRKLILGGEDLKTDLASTISRYFNDEISIFNEYGPTEATVGCMIHRFDPVNDNDLSVPIGRPIEGAAIYILDEGGKPVPDGVSGEIYIGGYGVAHGYLNRPDETAQRFLSNRFRVPKGQAVETHERLYRTGDIARRRADGIIEYLGRVDEQVKINGVRIEIGEIESALRGFDNVEDVVVIADSVAANNDKIDYCIQCGLASTHPDANINAAGVCEICEHFAAQKTHAIDYFGDMAELNGIVDVIKQGSTVDNDCMMLLSGGKDSTYALCQLVELGLNPLVFTLDNGFISEGAKANMERVVEHLGLELVVASTPAMNEVFVDSLKRQSNVCNGCFKVIYTLATNLAHERGIHYIFTGLSRGQIFETRVADQFKRKIFDRNEIDKNIVEARKIYHRMTDAVSKNLDVKLFADDRIFEEVKFVDFYRYCDVELGEVLDYLNNKVPWVRPEDTGRSTNCLINEAGIYVHKKERRHHNYALPYSWDVRLGHKERNAALAELDDNINLDNVSRILKEVGYEEGASTVEHSRLTLIAYVVAKTSIETGELREQLSKSLPAEYIPQKFVQLDALPLTSNGKLDRHALPKPENTRSNLQNEYVAPRGEIEELLAEIWRDVFGHEDIGVNDDFFDLGGDSILNIQIVSRAKASGLTISPQELFDNPTIAQAAAVCRESSSILAEQQTITGVVPLLPMQRRFLVSGRENVDHYNQATILRISKPYDVQALRNAWVMLCNHHDILRARFRIGDDTYVQELLMPEAVDFTIDMVEVDSTGGVRQKIADTLDAMHGSLNISSGPMFRLTLIKSDHDQVDYLAIVVHHLVIDGVSWWVLIDDLERVYHEIVTGGSIKLPQKTTSARQWSTAILEYRKALAGSSGERYWDEMDKVGMNIPIDYDDAENFVAYEQKISSKLSRDATEDLLHQAPSAAKVRSYEIILAALYKVIAEWSRNQTVKVDLEGHGRESLIANTDISRTVGWFTSVFPLAIKIDAKATAGEAVAAVKRALRDVPNNGADYNVLRFSESVGKNVDLKQSPVLFNYLGQWDRASREGAKFSLDGPVSGSFGKRGAREYLIEINGFVFETKLQIDWTFSTRCYRASTIKSLADRVMKEICELSRHCLDGDALLTPGDFPTAKIDQAELDDILAEFGE